MKNECCPRKRKGFTLIEMLVVIAIIAVLVAVALPTITSTTDKAVAAANAANLRALSEEAAVLFVTPRPSDRDVLTSGNIIITLGSNGLPTKIEVTDHAPTAKAIGKLQGGEKATLSFDDYQFTSKYGDFTTADFQAVADGTASSDSLN